MHYSVVIPVHNEQDNIVPVTEEIARILGPAGDFEVIFVDDGSTDATVTRLHQVRSSHGFVRVLRHHSRSGKSAALRTGVMASSATWIVTMDGDGQNDPRDVPRLLAAAAADPAVALVCGIRRRRDDTIWRRLASRIGNGVRQALLHDNCTDTACGLKLIRRDVFLALPFFDSLHRFFPALIGHRGHGVVMLDINDRARSSGTSKYTNMGRAVIGLADLFGVIWLKRRTTLPSGSSED